MQKKIKFPKAAAFLADHPNMSLDDAINYLDAAIKGEKIEEKT